jgi:preprotein translocase subunit YajC
MSARKGLALACVASTLFALGACSDTGSTGPTAPASTASLAKAPDPVVIVGGLVNVVVTNVLNNLTVDVDVSNNNVAVQVCAIVDLLSANPLFGTALTCNIEQGGGGKKGAQAGAMTEGISSAAAKPPVIIGGGLVNIVVTDVLNNVTVNIDVSNNNVAVQVCAAVDALDLQLFGDRLTCTITQK